MNDIIDMTTNRIEAVPYFVVRYSYNLYIIFREFCVAQRVFLRMFLFAVLRTVKLNNQFGFRTIKINDIPINYFLTNKSNRVIFQKIIPKMLFFLGHVFPEFLRERNYELVVSPVQANPSTASGPPPFAQGRQESSSSKNVLYEKSLAIIKSFFERETEPMRAPSGEQDRLLCAKGAVSLAD